MEQVDDGLSQSETKVAKIARDYNQAVTSTQRLEFQVESLVVKYALVKQSALADLYNLKPNGQGPENSKPLFVPRPSDKKVVQTPTLYNKEQQTFILALLRFKFLTPAHFKTIFGNQKEKKGQNKSQNKDLLGT